MHHFFSPLFSDPHYSIPTRVRQSILLAYGENTLCLQKKKTIAFCFFVKPTKNIMQAARALLKLYNSAEQSVNLPARGVASRGGSLFFMCNKAVGRSRWF